MKTITFHTTVIETRKYAVEIYQDGEIYERVDIFTTRKQAEAVEFALRGAYLLGRAHGVEIAEKHAVNMVQFLRGRR
jgi:hypothetical protein